MALRFMGIGAAKCATTWTYRVLASHPAVSFPAGKEVNFWLGPQQRGHEWYAATMATDDPDAVCGEISVSYVHLSRSRIREIHARYPDVRLFLHLRHPVDRAWSRAKMLVRDSGVSVADASDALLTEHLFAGRNIAAGDYSRVLDNWLAVFPSEQLLVARFEELTAEPAAAMQRLCEHIGIDPAGLDAKKLERRRRRSMPPERPLPDGLRDLLTRLYAEPMARLKDRYGIDYTGPGRS